MKKLIFILISLSFLLFSCEKEKVLEPQIPKQLDPIVKAISLPNGNIGKIQKEIWSRIGGFQIYNPNPKNSPNQYSQTIYSLTVNVENYQSIDSIFYVVGNSQVNQAIVKSQPELTFVLNQTFSNGNWSSPISLVVWRDSSNTNTGLVKISPISMEVGMNGQNQTLSLRGDSTNISFMIQ